MKIILTGANGQVGSSIFSLLNQFENYKIVKILRKNCDFRYPSQINKLFDKFEPDLVINAAAYTNVDDAEKQKELAYKVNFKSVKILAKKAFINKIPLIHFSTDYVFDGNKKKSYLENDTPKPLNTYGKSKLAGENAIREIDGQYYIFRTSWVYSNKKKNFYLTIKKLIKEKKELKIVSDQYGVPTSNAFIAQQIKKIIPLMNNKNKGVYHLVPNGNCSWYQFSKKIIKYTDQNFNIKNLHQTKSKFLVNIAKRPKNSVLNNDKIKKTFNLEFKSWHKTFQCFLKY
jgi:dTDP-4-dehydrorhamnose reductase